MNRKLLRDLWRIRGQVLAIALVVASGVAMYILAISTSDSLDLTQRTFYDRQRFAEVFAALKRAPMRIRAAIEDIPGVAQVETRVVADVTLDVRGFDEPAAGRLISVPEGRRPTLNDLHLRAGRYIEPGRPDEVIVAERFARAHGLVPGDAVRAVINGRRRDLRIVGLAISPEYVYAIRPGELLPDNSRFGVAWIGHKALASAFDMEGGFNDVTLSLMAGASEREVIQHLDRLLEPYGGLGAIPRSLQISHWYLDNELAQLRGLATVVPVIFLAVAALLLNVVLSRTITLQREQIAMLKAIGYSNAAVGVHYVLWALIVTLIGCVLGTLVGGRLGAGMTEMYTAFFDFPILIYRLLPATVAWSVMLSMAAGVIGTLGAVRRAVRLPPAEAMRPEPPASYRESWIERLGLKRLLAQPTRMIFRNLQRRPWRAAASTLGIGFGGAMLIMGSFGFDAIDEILDLQFNVAERQDLTISFVEPRSSGALPEAAHLPGVMYAEPFRSVPVRLRFGHRQRTGTILGLRADARLNRLIDADYEVVDLPPDGLVLSLKMAELLQVELGETLTVEVLEASRPVLQIPVSRIVENFLGTSVYMNIDALHRLMREGPSLSGAYLMTDEAGLDEAYRRIKETPWIAGSMLKRAAIQSFKDTLAETVNIFRFFNILFAAIVAFGVVYNAARISLSERDRELATLRVIGFSRTEISYILLGELAVLSLVGIPLGWILGYGLSAITVEAQDTELYRIPLIIFSRTYAFAAVTVLVSAIFSGLVVRRKLDRLDLVAVLKTRE